MAWTAQYNTFSASEAERITGIDQVTQRDLRRRGYLPPNEAGKARFDAVMLAGMIASNALSNAGLPPAASWVLSRACGVAIAAKVLNARRGVLDPDSLLNEDLIKVGEESGVKARWMVTEDARSWAWAKSADELVDHLGAASVVLDLDKLADQLVKRAGKVLVTIEAEAA